MMEKVSIDFARQIYNLLTMSSGDVNFYCMCLQNQNREAATNSPVKFALKLIKINVLCRLPKIKNNLFSARIGENYLSGIFVRPMICEIASGMLDNSALITDVFGSALVPLKSRKEFFTEIESELEIKGFAKLREKYDYTGVSIKTIYEKIGSELHRTVDFKVETELAKRLFIPNKYIIRMIEIASCNGLSITAVADTSYSADFVKKLLKRHNINPNKLIVSNENGKLTEESLLDGERTCVLSGNYKFIKRFIRHGCAPIYYRDARVVTECIDHPGLSGEFRRVYDILCGMRLFSGIKRYGREYEIAYMCVAPCVLSLAGQIKRKLEKGEHIICLCSEDSVFAGVLKVICEKTDNIVFFPWSALAADKHKTVSAWKEIVDEMPIFDCAESGVLDSFMRYPVSKVENVKYKNRTESLTSVISAAWVDKTSEGVTDAVRSVLDEIEKITVCDPLPGNRGIAEFCRELEKADENIIYKCFSMNGRLETDRPAKPLARVLQGNKPLLVQIGQNGEKRWVYQKKIPIDILKEFNKAIYDFANDLCKYLNITGENYLIDGTDAFALYQTGERQIEKIIDEKD